MLGVLRFFQGYHKIKVEKEHAAKTVNLLFKEAIDYFKLENQDDGSITFYIISKEFKKMSQKSAVENETLAVIKDYGLPSIFKRYRKRYGLFVGFFVFALLLMLSDSFVWKINISGNTTLRNSEITEALDRIGFGVGSYIPTLDLYDLSSKAMIECREASWFSITLNGTTAEVEIRESNQRPQEDSYVKESDTPSNMIAKADGKIVRMEILNGSPTVNIGDEVRAGDILISGVYDYGTAGQFRILRSYGRVYAQSSRIFTAEIPIKQQIKSYTGKYNIEKSIFFFGKEINFNKDSRLSYQLCDTIYDREYIDVFGICELPIMVATKTENEYIMTEKILTDDEAKVQALAKMSKILSDELTDAEIISRKDIFEKYSSNQGDILRLVCEIECIDNIAVEKEIGLS